MDFVGAVFTGLEFVGMVIGYLTIFCFAVILLWWWWVDTNKLPGSTERTEAEDQKLIDDVRIAGKEGKL